MKQGARKTYGVAATLLMAGSLAMAGEGRIEISQGYMPYDITNSGSYVVTEPLEGVASMNGIRILASDVSLDLNGFPLTGVAGSLSGIMASPGLVNVAVRNGMVSDWGSDGVGLSGTTNVFVEQLRAARNGRDGIRGGTASTVIDCNVLGNGRNGISCEMGGIISRCTVRLSGGHGVVAGQGSTLSLCAVRDSVSNGFTVADACVLSDCTARSNSDHGFLADTGATLSDCNAYGNSDDGYRLMGGGSKLSGSVSYANGDFGVVVGDGALVTRCSVRSNIDGGISVSSNCYVVANIFDNHAAGPGVLVTDANNRVESNTSSRNLVGLQVLGTNNLLVRNSLTENVTNLDVLGGNHISSSVNPGTSMPNEAWINFSL